MSPYAQNAAHGICVTASHRHVVPPARPSACVEVHPLGRWLGEDARRSHCLSNYGASVRVDIFSRAVQSAWVVRMVLMQDDAGMLTRSGGIRRILSERTLASRRRWLRRKSHTLSGDDVYCDAQLALRPCECLVPAGFELMHVICNGVQTHEN